MFVFVLNEKSCLFAGAVGNLACSFIARPNTDTYAVRIWLSYDVLPLTGVEWALCRCLRFFVVTALHFVGQHRVLRDHLSL